MHPLTTTEPFFTITGSADPDMPDSLPGPAPEDGDQRTDPGKHRRLFFGYTLAKAFPRPWYWYTRFITVFTLDKLPMSKHPAINFCLLLCLSTSLASAPVLAQPGSTTFDTAQTTITHFGDGTHAAGTLTVLRHNNRHRLSDNQTDDRDTTLFSYSQLLGDNSWHVAGMRGSELQNLNLGVTFGATTLTLANGKGSERAWHATSAFGIHGAFKTGFNPAAYRYSQVGLDHRLGSQLNLRAGSINLDLDGRLNPDAYYAGLSYHGWSGNYLHIARNGLTLGEGLQLAYENGPWQLSYRGYRNFNDFSLHGLQLAFRHQRNDLLTLNLHSGTSPFNGARDNRVLLAFSTRWGRGASLASHAAAGPQPTPEDGTASPAGRPQFNKAVLIGGAAAVVVAAAGSSSGGGDGGSSGFATQHQAARNVLNTVNPISVKQNREHGGWVYQLRDNSFASTAPVAGSVASVDIGDPRSSVPGSTTATASYHTHGGPDPRYDNEHFSPTDIATDLAQRVDGYLGTPAGTFQYHNYRTGNISTLGRIAN
jgi:hypothetical protein